MNPLDYKPEFPHPFPDLMPEEIPDIPEEDEEDD